MCDLTKQELKNPQGSISRTDIWPCKLSVHAALKTLPPCFLLQLYMLSSASQHVCVCVWGGVCVWMCVFECYLSCLGGSQTKNNIGKRNETSGVKRKPTQPVIPILHQAFGQFPFTLVPLWNTTRPHLRWQWPAPVKERDSGSNIFLHVYNSVEKHCCSAADFTSQGGTLLCTSVSVCVSMCMMGCRYR